MTFIAHVEICLAPQSGAKFKDVSCKVEEFLKANYIATSQEGYPLKFMPNNEPFVVDVSSDPYLLKNTVSVKISEIEDPHVRIDDLRLQTHVYQPSSEGPATEMQEDSDAPASQQWELPSQEFEGLWESLLFDDNLKKSLLAYVTATLLFSDKLQNKKHITCNRLVILHGPPGTGKTSLCKALAQKVSIRLSHRYPQGVLIEINAHSLFSKWFSESGKMVLKVFDSIREIVEEEDTFVFVLLDEVESLSAAREAALNGNEPSDSLRVVNALLTQIDRLSAYKNVLVLATTNITKAIDTAFIDRADFSTYIGLPSLSARYVLVPSAAFRILTKLQAILQSCVAELVASKIMYPSVRINRNQFDSGSRTERNEDYKPNFTVAELAQSKLYHIAEAAEGMSGRALRKLPLKAYALYLSEVPECSVDEFLGALKHTIEKEKANVILMKR